jgi:hypothetical protein
MDVPEQDFSRGLARLRAQRKSHMLPVPNSTQLADGWPSPTSFHPHAFVHKLL